MVRWRGLFSGTKECELVGEFAERRSEVREIVILVGYPYEYVLSIEGGIASEGRAGENLRLRIVLQRPLRKAEGLLGRPISRRPRLDPEDNLPHDNLLISGREWLLYFGGGIYTLAKITSLELEYRAYQPSSPVRRENRRQVFPSDADGEL